MGVIWIFLKNKWKHKYIIIIWKVGTYIHFFVCQERKLYYYWYVNTVLLSIRNYIQIIIKKRFVSYLILKSIICAWIWYTAAHSMFVTWCRLMHNFYHYYHIIIILFKITCWHANKNMLYVIKIKNSPFKLFPHFFLHIIIVIMFWPKAL